MRDDGFRHLQYEELDDERATQRLHNRSAVLGDNRVADNGILESITCVNFMCHIRLHCDLGPLLNFIVGENGSGKSAILTAITLCLGGKPSSTNRGANLKTFVREGQDQAILSVKIKNRGVDAYQHDVYGDSITVERHFSRSGSSGFKVRSATGRLISMKKSEVDEIVEYYCLQVDNPLNVLSQDNARQFLNAASASMKYKFFIKGVQLEQLDKDYELVKELLDANEEKLPVQEERVRVAKREFEAAEKQHRLIQSNSNLVRERRLYRNQLIWAQVVEQEAILREREAAVLAAEASITEAEQLKIQRGEALEIETENLHQAELLLASVKEADAEFQQRVDSANQAYSSARKELESLHSIERDAHGRLTQASESVKDLEKKIHEEQRRLEDANGDIHKQTRDQLEAARQEEETISAEIAEATSLVPQLEQKQIAADAAVKDANSAAEQKCKEIRAIEGKIRGLQQTRGSPYDAYEPQLPKLLSAIREDGGFVETPVGPIGSHIQVVQPGWSSILEKTLGGTLNGFIVTSKRDQQRLRNLMQRHGVQRCPILIANRQPINTSGKEPDPEFDTILRILKFDDELVRNQLIITSNIEQVILIQDRKRAEEVMFNGPAPRNVAACLSLHDGKRGEGLRLSNKGGNISTTPVIPGNQKPRMKSDMDGQIAVQNEILEQLRADLGELESHRRLLQQASQHALAQVKLNGRKLVTLRQKLREAQASINRIEEDLDKFDGADGRLQSLQEAMAQGLAEKEQYGDAYGDAKVRKKDKNKQIEGLRKELGAEKLRQQAHKAQVDKAEDKVSRCRDLRHLALVEKNAAFEEVDKCLDDKRLAEGKRDRQADRVQEFIRDATVACRDRVYLPDGETYAIVEKKLESVEKQLESRRRALGMTDEEVNHRVVTRKQAYEQANDVWNGTKEQVMGMSKALAARLTKWRIFQRHISAASRTNFIYLLSERGFKGRLLLDHRTKKLQVQVEPDETRETSSGRSTKTLSGGEKSFSSICLLLAIWEAMGSPLRCLDEFDVFMDSVNRAISTDMLVGVQTTRHDLGGIAYR